MTALCDFRLAVLLSPLVIGIDGAAAEDLDLPRGEAISFVPLPAGAFLMGSPESDESARRNERPQQEVTVSAFSLARTETTQRQFEALMGYNPSHCPSGCGPEYPVQAVTWHEAAAFCNAVSAVRKLPLFYETSGEGTDVRVTALNGTQTEGYRLPTEAEWEYAARAGTTSVFWWGDEREDICGHVNFADASAREMFPDWAWTAECDDGHGHAAPVGSFPSNPWGVSDMLGNVAEWTGDLFVERLSDAPSTDLQTVRIDVAEEDQRVLRGGSYNTNSSYLRAAMRSVNGSLVRYPPRGFRCARSLSTAP